jgi:hypothetical protein
LAGLRDQANDVANDNFIWVRKMPKAGQPREPVAMLCKGALLRLTQSSGE